MKYRKKPIVIEAFQMTPERRESNADWPEWLHAAWNKKRVELGALFPAKDALGLPGLFINTLEGDMRVSENDWIIRGIRDEIYPCKPDIFEASYEPVPEGGE
jgi:hypothetical protein